MRQSEIDPRIVNLLLGLVSVLFLLTGLMGWRWWHATRNSATLDQLSAEQRYELTEAVLAASPGIYQAAWYEPSIGYTLRPSASRLQHIECPRGTLVPLRSARSRRRGHGHLEQ